MTTHCVIANDGYISPPMSAFEAYRYGRRLEELGNYDIHVTTKRKADEYRLRQMGVIV